MARFHHVAFRELGFVAVRVSFEEVAEYDAAGFTVTTIDGHRCGKSLMAVGTFFDMYRLRWRRFCTRMKRIFPI